MTVSVILILDLHVAPMLVVKYKRIFYQHYCGHQPTWMRNVVSCVPRDWLQVKNIWFSYHSSETTLYLVWLFAWNLSRGSLAIPLEYLKCKKNMPVRNKNLKQNWCLNILTRIKIKIILPWKGPVLIESSLFHFEQFPDGLAREK